MTKKKDKDKQREDFLIRLGQIVERHLSPVYLERNKECLKDIHDGRKRKLGWKKYLETKVKEDYNYELQRVTLNSLLEGRNIRLDILLILLKELEEEFDFSILEIIEEKCKSNKIV